MKKAWGLYALAALVVVLPLFQPGYVLTLDMVFAPNIPRPVEITNSYLFEWLLYILNFVFPAQVIQKGLLFLILFLSGIAMHSLSGAVASREARQDQWVRFTAGLFYMINPFVYTRFMAGQFLVLLGYALLPFFALSVLRLCREPNFKNSLALTGCAVIISVVSIHSIFMMVIIAGVFLGAHAIYGAWQWRQVLVYVGASLGMWLLVSTFWLMPVIKGEAKTNQLIEAFNEQHLEAFATRSDHRFGLAFNVAGLHGFWGDTDSRYALPKEQGLLWPILTIVIIALSAVGLYSGYRENSVGLISLTIIGFVGWLLSMGAQGLVGILYRWALDYIPLFNGYREPQKFMMLLLLAYAPVIAAGASYLKNNCLRPTRYAHLVVVGMLLLPFIYTPTMLWGFAGQVKPIDYPAEWYALNESLLQDKDDFKVLFLPWHHYLSFDFNNRVIANPANLFFDVPVIQADNVEIGAVYRQTATPETLFVEDHVLRQKEHISEAGTVLAKINIKYVIIAKNNEIKEFDFLEKQRDLKLVHNGQHLLVYENQEKRTSFSP